MVGTTNESVPEMSIDDPTMKKYVYIKLNAPSFLCILFFAGFFWLLGSRTVVLGG